MQYTGTRFSTVQRDGYRQLTGTTGAFVSYRLNDQGPIPYIANAGAFCTSSYVVGSGAYVQPTINGTVNRESGSYTAFYVSCLCRAAGCICSDLAPCASSP
jgi:hypothetical protein